MVDIVVGGDFVNRKITNTILGLTYDEKLHIIAVSPPKPPKGFSVLRVHLPLRRIGLGGVRSAPVLIC